MFILLSCVNENFKINFKMKNVHIFEQKERKKEKHRYN